jgi:hypothetical protein
LFKKNYRRRLSLFFFSSHRTPFSEYTVSSLNSEQQQQQPTTTTTTTTKRKNKMRNEIGRK